MKRKRIWRLFALIVVVLVLLPYAFSRLVSPWRRITVFSSDSVQTASVPTQFRVACYNIAHGRGLAKSNFNGESAERRLQRLDEIADLLVDIDADIVVLNEVDFESSWSQSVNQAEYLASKAGYPFRVEQRNYDLRVLSWKWRFGNAVLSRFPVQNVRLLDLPDHATWEAVVAGKKCGLQAEVLIGKTPTIVLMYVSLVGAIICMGIAITSGVFPAWLGTVALITIVVMALFPWEHDMRGNIAEGSGNVQRPSLIVANMIALLWLAQFLGILVI